MRKWLNDALIVVICMVTWLILNERLDWQTALLGIVLAVVAVLFNNLVLNHDLKDLEEKLNLLVMPKYFFNLIIQIYIAGFDIIIKIITGKINPDIVEIDVDLDNDLYICLLANSITLTPGTVTIDKKGNKLTVLWLDCLTKDKQAAGEIIKGSFERILRGG